MKRKLKIQPRWAPLLLLVVCLAGLATADGASRTGVHVGSLRLSPAVESLSQLRWKNLVRQGWDLSCGAAALSTLLTYHHGREFSEMAVTLTILKNSDPALVRARGGFSLYDLKRFVRAVGLDGIGYGEMSLDDLALFDIPAILPIRINNIDHFVIYRARLGGHVMLGDPAFGNISLPANRFEKLWKSKIAFYAVSKTEKKIMDEQQASQSRSPLSPEAMEMALPNLGYLNRVTRRASASALSRRLTTVSH